MGKNSKIKRYITAFTIIIAVLLVLIIWNISYGSVDMKFRDITNALFLRDESTLSKIIWQIRMPRLIAAILLGGALSVSGFLLQSFFQNPIAGPYVLGISSGAKLVVALVMIFCWKRDYDKFAWNGDRSVYRFAAGNDICSRHII